ncbi:MAG TPA: class I SAM-dependent methyltransferase [bacterium]|nr:class I SAM-dependent methyltransferase [bacterium]
MPLHGRVLDLGFGSGWDMRYFHSRGYEVAGIDISRRQVVRARESLPYADVHLGDIARADECFSLESFDGIWACAAIVHIDRIQAEKTFHSMYRLLRPGGSAYVSVKCRSDVNAPEIVEKPSRSSDGIVKRYIYWLPEDLFAALRST